MQLTALVGPAGLPVMKGYAAGFDTLYDDRPKVSPGVKFGDAELVGVPLVVVVGRGAADGIVEFWNRATGERSEIALADVPAAL